MDSQPAHGIFVWNELNSHDVEAAKSFYGATLGWTFEPTAMEGGDTYWTIKLGEVRVGGIFPLSAPEFAKAPAHWLAYLAVDDIDARIARIAAAGGSVLRPAFDVPGVGRVAIVRDAEGATMGWITPNM
ncbi:MAG TPA: VOC family protein [Ancylobacter sp.]